MDKVLFCFSPNPLIMKTIQTILNKSSWLIIFFIIPFIAFTQIQGIVIDANKQPLSFANVVLLNQMDSSIVSGTMATEEGTYLFTGCKPGGYILRISMIGYKTTSSPPFIISGSDDNLLIEPIVAEEESYQLNDINIVAKKPVYELKVDRMVVNVENSITAAGNTILEVLEKSPGVIVDRQNNALTLSGKSGVTVMINGKQNRMPMVAAFQMLDAMSADNIKQIELITAPPARYDAEGDAGIINIILKKKESLGTNGSVVLRAGYWKQEKLNGSLNLNHGLEKINFYGLYDIDYNNSIQTATMNDIIRQPDFVFETNTKSVRDIDVVYQNARFGFDYNISTKTFLGVLFTGYKRVYCKVAINDILYKENQQPSGQSKLRNPSSDT